MARQPARRQPQPVVQDAIEPLGTVRRSQLISTYAIGAIVDLEKGSFMPMGLDDLEGVTRLPSLTIGEPRLEAMLGVSHFRLGPVVQSIPGFRTVSARNTVPAVRFPEWHECPRCHRIGTEGSPFELAADGSRLTCLAHGGTVYTSPVRFVVACRRGHISDFPWIWWAHRDRAEGVCDSPSLYLGSLAQSASLADLYVECKACRTGTRPTRQSLGSAFSPAALSGRPCSGVRPWLHDREQGCPEQEVRALQRGASNVHFPVVASALSIPPASEAATQIVQEMRDMLEAVPADTLPQVMAGLAGRYGLTAEPLIVAWRNLRALETGLGQLTERMARADEYAALSEDRDDPVVAGVVPQFRNHVHRPPAPLDQWFDLVGAVSRLREVRALAGFSRIEPHPVSAERVEEAIRQGAVSPLSKRPKDWRPAAEIRGEGIFLRFRSSAIDSWAADEAIAARAATLDAISADLASRRGYARDYRITPRLLLVHSFAHALIRQISIECGYSASALRERLYVAEPEQSSQAMNGFLIYTGSPDSEGSLGGLVRLAAPELLGPIIRRTLRSVSWCGSDPVCLETMPIQSGERVSGAACHCCLLLPETACEKFNRELDRALLVGDIAGAFAGFFGEQDDVAWPS